MTNIFFSTNNKLGVLGAGQLGKMLLPHTHRWDIFTKMLDPDKEAPCNEICNEFVHGSLQDFDTVYNFGKDCDVITIEIEKVNVEALKKLQQEGKKIHPNPYAIETIQDKGLQKQFYQQHNIPTSPFLFFENTQEIKQAIEENKLLFPFVQKARKDGYDGRGVSIINKVDDLHLLLETPCIVEEKINIKAELSIIACKNENGEIVTYEPVGMDFHEGANMLDLLLYPMDFGNELNNEAKQIAEKLITEFNICGLLAVEFIIDINNKLWVNEVAPRPHNSGHQTIENAITSQYENHIRAILNLPLGATKSLQQSAMVNILGAIGYEGHVHYEGIEEVLQQENVHIHIYGKKITKPFRKMGHATVLHNQLNEAKKIALWIKEKLQVKSL